ncbi:MAG: AMP-binding protein [Candidatus Heimdallarchaeota archaeon]|nr:AMP-binding protein [Candidatus Heimdallarchaeota archaeon]
MRIRKLNSQQEKSMKGKNSRWVSIYHPNIPFEIEIPDKDLATLFFEQARINAKQTFLIFEGKTKKYSQVSKEVTKLANSLLKLGIQKGDRIALLMPNCPQFVISYLSTLAIGGITTAISPLYSASEIKFQLKDSGATAIITLDMFLDKIRLVKKETNLRHVIVSSIADELNPLKGFLYKNILGRKNPKRESPELSYKKLIKNGIEKKIEIKIDAKNDLATLQYTGGTTGIPKGAMLTHHNLISQVIVLDYWMEWIGGKLPGIRDRSIGAIPFSHIFGLTTSFLWPFSVGGLIVIIPDPRELETIMKLIQKYKIHFFMGVPILYQKIAEHPKVTKYDWSSIRACISGGSALHKSTLHLFEEKTNALLVEGYGLSEASPVTHINPVDDTLRRIGIGIPIPNTQAKLIDIDTEEDIPEKFPKNGLTQEGELAVKGPQVMKGYWKQPEETEKVFTAEGWLKTGDVAKMTEQGFFIIVDRLKDCIFTSGYQVWPLEIEEVLCKHPDISLAAVVPFVDEQANEKPKAFLVAAPNAPKRTPNELREFCKQYLAPYKVPKDFEYREELPISPVGKILRRPLREELEKLETIKN